MPSLVEEQKWLSSFPGSTLSGDRSHGHRAVADPLELIDPSQVRHILISPRQRAKRTEELMFGDHPPPKCSITIEPDVAEWDYGKYEGMLTKDIRKEHPGWEIWKDG